MRSREQEAGVLYEEGSKAVRSGGHELSRVASHLVFMLRGTAQFQGPLWSLRILHDGREIKLDRFMDYLTLPERRGLGLPSMHFLRQVLAATPEYGEEALALVREQLARELIDFDAVADEEARELVRKKTAAVMQQREQQDAANKRPVGRPRKTVSNEENDGNRKGRPVGNTIDYAVRKLREDRADLHARVLAGELSAHAAMVEAGFRKRRVVAPPSVLTRLLRDWQRATPEDQAAFLTAVGAVRDR